MSIIATSLGAARKLGTTAPVAKAAARTQGFFARLLQRLIEARQRQAANELRLHGLRLPRELEEAGLKINERNEDALPFVR